MNSWSRNLGLELVRATEAAAVAASAWVGKGDAKGADKAATDQMRARLNLITFKGIVVSGEGRKDQAPQLYEGEEVGTGTGEEIDLAVDPLECTDSVANGRPNATCVIAAGSRNSFLKAPDMYMNKIAVGPGAKGVIDLEAPAEDNLKKIAKALGKEVGEVTVCVLDRPRHVELIKEIRKAGARVTLISDGDVAGAIATAMPDSPIDVLMGIGAAVEGVQASIALKCLGGELQGKLQPKDTEEEEMAKVFCACDINKVMLMKDLVPGDDVMFIATGVIDGPLLQGVRYMAGQVKTHSVVMRNTSKTVRYIEAIRSL